MSPFPIGGRRSDRDNISPLECKSLPWAYRTPFQQLRPLFLTTNVSNKSGNLLFAQNQPDWHENVGFVLQFVQSAPAFLLKGVRSCRHRLFARRINNLPQVRLLSLAEYCLHLRRPIILKRGAARGFGRQLYYALLSRYRQFRPVATSEGLNLAIVPLSGSHRGLPVGTKLGTGERRRKRPGGGDEYPLPFTKCKRLLAAKLNFQ
jgi:hypothetical protein